MPKWDATNSNNSNRISRTFKDLDLDFGLNTVTKDVNKLTDAEAIKRSVRNLINTNHYERAFHPEIGRDGRSMLFEPMTPLTALNLQRKVFLLGKLISTLNCENFSYCLTFFILRFELFFSP